MSKTRNERKRQKEELFFYLTVAVWAVFCVWCLYHGLQKQVYEPVEEPVPETITVVSEAQLYQKPEIEQVEEANEVIDLTKFKQIENATLTHYCICKSCCGKETDHPAYGITASGRKAEPYLSVAVDPFLIPLGSTVYIDYGDGEIKEYRADDTGSGVAGAHIDLCVSDHEEALELGVKTVKVWWSE